uniref:Uncharacterized protein n=1 Tax=Vespula pensylvanica TaxID=30213 RepID=A0A834NR94_VESPE|nr:hypothetical protein H0235_012594 [Vespula pensylvanica]
MGAIDHQDQMLAPEVILQNVQLPNYKKRGKSALGETTLPQVQYWAHLPKQIDLTTQKKNQQECVKFSINTKYEVKQRGNARVVSVFLLDIDSRGHMMIYHMTYNNVADIAFIEETMIAEKCIEEFYNLAEYDNKNGSSSSQQSVQSTYMPYKLKINSNSEMYATNNAVNSNDVNSRKLLQQNCKHNAEFRKIESRRSNYKTNLDCLIINKNIIDLPLLSLSCNTIDTLNIKLTEPGFHTSTEVDLIEIDAFWKFVIPNVSGQIIQSVINSPYATSDNKKVEMKRIGKHKIRSSSLSSGNDDVEYFISEDNIDEMN